MAWGPFTGRGRIALEALAIAAVITLVVAWTRLSGSSRLLYRGGFLVCAIAVAVVIAAAVHPARPIRQGLVERQLRGLGIISYGVYLGTGRCSCGSTSIAWTLRLAALRDPVRDHVSVALGVVPIRRAPDPVRLGLERLMRICVPASAAALVVVLVSATSGAS